MTAIRLYDERCEKVSKCSLLSPSFSACLLTSCRRFDKVKPSAVMFAAAAARRRSPRLAGRRRRRRGPPRRCQHLAVLPARRPGRPPRSALLSWGSVERGARTPFKSSRQFSSSPFFVTLVNEFRRELLTFPRETPPTFPAHFFTPSRALSP